MWQLLPEDGPLWTGNIASDRATFSLPSVCCHVIPEGLFTEQHILHCTSVIHLDIFSGMLVEIALKCLVYLSTQFWAYIMSNIAG